MTLRLSLRHGFKQQGLPVQSETGLTRTGARANYLHGLASRSKYPNAAHEHDDGDDDDGDDDDDDDGTQMSMRLLGRIQYEYI